MILAAVTTPLVTVMAMLPPGDGDPAATGHGPEWGKAAPIGLLVWLLLGLAVFLLVKSLNRHLKRVPASFDPAPPDAGDAGGAASDDGSGVERDAAGADPGAGGDGPGDGAAGGDGPGDGADDAVQREPRPAGRG